MDNEEPLLTNNRAQREWAWIVAQVGEQAAREAIARIPGRRKPYPLNIARVLGLRLPQELAVTPREEARQRLQQIRAMFK